MYGIQRMLAVALLVTMAAAMPSAHGLQISSTQAGHSTGCHRHGPANPGSNPRSFQCCVSGHAAAIPNAVFSLCCVTAPAGDSDDSFGARLAFHFFPGALSAVASASPPDMSPLRI